MIPFRTLVGLTAMLAACAPAATGALPEATETRLAAEGVLHRAEDVTFRYTRGAGTSEARWEDRVGAIVVTGATVLIHKAELVGVEITPSSRRFYQVNREGGRVRLTAGSGESREIWSFEPADSAEAWTRDIRAVIRGSRSIANP